MDGRVVVDGPHKLEGKGQVGEFPRSWVVKPV